MNKTIKYERGTEVEVISKEEGLEGSMFGAIIVTELETDEYIVTYKTLLREGHSEPLREVVNASELRPDPPDIPAHEFRLHQRVDAFDKDGWWTGKIIGIIDSTYNVYFESSGEELPYGADQLRVHQDWVNGKWVIPSPKNRK